MCDRLESLLAINLDRSQHVVRQGPTDLRGNVIALLEQIILNLFIFICFTAFFIVYTFSVLNFSFFLYGFVKKLYSISYFFFASLVLDDQVYIFLILVVE